MEIIKKVQLITYADSLGGDLKNLAHVLDKYFPYLFEGGIHILPPFPSSGDRGFAPIDYFEIDKSFGSWEDIENLAKDYNIILDMMVNHISAQSLYFKDFLSKGEKSEYTDMFLTMDKIWEDGKINQEDIDKIFLRRDKPYSCYDVQYQDTKEYLWTTFGKTDPSEQIDLDVNSDVSKKLYNDIFAQFSSNGIKMIRLDAIGYVIKKMGTSCFFVEPEIYKFMDWIKSLAGKFGMEVLLEVHAHREIQNKLADMGYWIYDFILPYLVLESLILRSARNLISYLSDRPSNQFTMLDCHDGIPVLPDLEGYIEISDAEKVVKSCIERGANLSRIVSEEHKARGGFDVHQINGSYYSMLGCDDDAYIAARAIQFFTPGIPQVYYVGLLAGENDYGALECKGDGREVNRHNYEEPEILSKLDTDVVKRLMKLIGFRNTHPAFEGEFTAANNGGNILEMKWTHEGQFCILHVDLSDYKTTIKHSGSQGELKTYKV